MRSLVLISLAFLLSACAHTQAPIESPFYYELSKGSNRGVLLGTLRTGVTIEDLPSRVRTDFEAADAFVMESRIGNVDISDRFSRGGATQLTTLLKPDEYNAMVTWLNSAFYAEQTSQILATDSPVGAAEKLALARMCDRNFNQCRSMRYLQFTPLEMQFFERRRSIDVRYIEADEVAAQTRGCLSWSDAETRENILASLTGADSLKREVDQWAELEAAYRSGDDERVRIAASKYRTPEAYACVITKRNESFVPAIEEVLGRYRAPFITVSVGHLEGEGSLLQRLERAGFRVERVGFEKLRKAR